MAERRGLTGVYERGTYTGGFSGTWEILSSPRDELRMFGLPRDHEPGPRWVRTFHHRSELMCARVVPVSEGHAEVIGDGRQEVGASRSTAEVGEPAQGTRWREGGAVLENRGRDRCRRHQAPAASQRNKRG